MRLRLLALAVITALSSVLALAPASGQAQSAKQLKNIPATAQSAQGTFEGTVDITSFSSNGTQITASGVVKGVAKTTGGNAQNVRKEFSGVPVSLLKGRVNVAPSKDAAPLEQAGCDILSLDIGPIDLDLLGLVVDLSPISLDITAQRGPGNLLGNLLCAITGLLDTGNFVIIVHLLNALLDILT